MVQENTYKETFKKGYNANSLVEFCGLCLDESNISKDEFFTICDDIELTLTVKRVNSQSSSSTAKEKKQ